MGVWGTGLYSDDTARDVREDYKDILGDGNPEPEATNQILKQWEREISDPDTGPVIWLALADTQWNLGRLQELVKNKALQIIEEGSDLSRWQSDPKLVSKRKQVLARLRKKLNSLQPAEKKVKKRFVNSTDWRLGEVYSYKLSSCNFILLHVIGFHQDKGGRGPVCEILDWTGEIIPSNRAIRKMGYIFANEPSQHLSQFLFGSLGPKDFQEDRVEFVAKHIKPKQKCEGYSAINWRFADKQIEDLFGLE